MQKKLQHHIFNHLHLKNVHKEILTPTLFTSQDSILHKSIPNWITELTETLQHPTLEELAHIFTDAIMIFMALDKFQHAREVCYAQIQLFIHLGRTTRKLLKYTFTPWLNLIRIDRLTKNYHAALNKINALNLASGAGILTGENRFLTRALQDALILDPISLSEMKTASVTEFIKMNFIMKRYHELIQFIHYQHNESGIHKPILYEAKLIALMNSGRNIDARQYLEMLKPILHGKNIYLFKLRACEMGYADANDLYLFACESLNISNINVHDVIYVLHVVRLLVKAGSLTNGYVLASLALKAAQVLQDDWLITEAMLALYQLADKNERHEIEYSLIKHYFHTQYVAARNKMLQHYPNLKYVERQDCQVQAISLYEKLLTICHFY